MHSFTGKNNGVTATEVTTNFLLKYETTPLEEFMSYLVSLVKLPMFAKVINPRDNLLLTS